MNARVFLLLTQRFLSVPGPLGPRNWQALVEDREDFEADALRHGQLRWCVELLRPCFGTGVPAL
jgi:hypothetical protein